VNLIEETSISGKTPNPTTTPESLELFIESDDSNPLHVNYDFTKSEPLSIINDDDNLLKKKVKGRSNRHYKVKK
jgi:hypothetical protein